jgi:hypothetical protein
MTPAITEPAPVTPKPQSGIGMPNSTVKGTVLLTVTSLEPPQLVLSGGNLTTDGWEASGSTITLSSLSLAGLPVLYELSFEVGGGVFQLAAKGLQVSGSVGEAFFGACVMDSPLDLVNSVATPEGGVTLNLGMILQSIADPTLTLAFGDPTIVFDPPQT